jgi:hypothetical protein
MSDLLDKAIVDAKTLKEVATRNAESLIVEKYSKQIKEAINFMLEKDDEELNGDMGGMPSEPSLSGDDGGAMSPGGSPEGMDAPPMDMGSDSSLLGATSSETSLADSQVPMAAGTNAPGQDDMVEIDFSGLDNQTSDEQGLEVSQSLDMGNPSSEIPNPQEMPNEMPTDSTTGDLPLPGEEKKNVPVTENENDGVRDNLVRKLQYHDEMMKYYLEASKKIPTKKNAFGMNVITPEIQAHNDAYREHKNAAAKLENILTGDGAYDSEGIPIEGSDEDILSIKENDVVPSNSPPAWNGGDTEQDITLEDIDEGLLNELMEAFKVGYEPALDGWLGSNPVEKREYEDGTKAVQAAHETSESEEEEKKEDENESWMKERVELQESLKRTTNKSNKVEKELAVLQKDNRELKNNLKVVLNKLNESNISNAKLLYTNRTLENSSLNERQKKVFVEQLSKVDSVEQAKVIYETLNLTGLTGKSSKPQSLNEIVSKPSMTSLLTRQHEEKKISDPLKDRMRVLAGIGKK